MSDPERQLITLFGEALELASAADRSAYLDRACGDDQALRQQVEALLEAHEQVGRFLDSQSSGVGVTSSAAGETDAGLNRSQPDLAETPGTVVGAYKLLEQVGEGGMGVVWMAQQTAPVKRVVALKLIKAGMDSRQVIARFEAERQALALMDHPNIARVLDAGATSAGRPYFVMDLVKGVPITRYCDEHQLTPRQRLELFIPVCQAVQHAHQKGIIHRDLKPSNVLVTLCDGKPVPKVIDFGVAKAAGQPLTDKTLVTGFGNIVGTLEYMSPEQAEFNQLDIDTRSDIYSLGVLLYELLAGSPPFTRKELEGGGMLEMLRVIREQEPTRPSTKLSTAEGLPTLAANRGTEPAKLTRLVRGELDWIAMKALEKDRSRRYETANAFALDVQRYLADEPVLAGPPSPWYRFRKFARRNRTRLALAATLGLLLLSAAAFAWHADRQAAERRADAADREREERTRLAQNAEAMAALLDQCESDLRADQGDRAAVALSAAERRAAEGGAEELADRLSRCRADMALLRELDAVNNLQWTWTHTGFGAILPDNETLKARLRELLTGYGATPGKAPPAEAARRINDSLVRERLLAALDFWLALAPSSSERRAGNPEEAWVRDVLRSADPDTYRDAVRDAVFAGGAGTLLPALLGKAEALEQPARYTAILGLFKVVPAERRRTILESALRARPGDLALLMSLGESYKPKDREGVRERLRWFQAAVAAHPRSTAAHANLADVLQEKGDRDGAIAELREAIRLDPKNPRGPVNLGLALGDKEGFAEFQKAVELDPKDAVARMMLGLSLGIRGELDRGLAELQEAVNLKPKNATVRIGLGTGLLAMKKLDEAFDEFQEAVRLDSKHPFARHALGHALRLKGDVDGAILENKAALQISPDLAPAHNDLGWILATGKARVIDGKKALEHATRACELSEWKVPGYIATLAAACAQVGDFDRAVEFQKRALSFPAYEKDFGEAVWEVLAAYAKKERVRDAKLDPSPERALPLLQQLATEIEIGGFRYENAAAIIKDLISCHERLKQFDKAETWRRKWLAALKENVGGDSLAYASELWSLSGNLFQQEKWKDAEPVLRECLAVYEQKARRSWMKFETESMLGAALLGQTNYADAEPLLLAGYEGMKSREKAVPATVKARLIEAADRLVQLYDATGKSDEAAKWRAIREQHKGARVGGVHEVGDGLKLHGKLDEKTLTLVYEVKLSAGKTYVIDMISPDQKALDPYLVLKASDGRHLAEDDDGGGGLNARITYRAPRDGVCGIHATSYGDGRGEFMLLVREKK